MPTTVVKTIRASGGDYTTLSAWEAANQGDLVAADEIRVAECYNDWPGGLNDAVYLDGSTEDATRYLMITVAPGHRHDGTPGTGFHIRRDQDWLALVRLNASSRARLEWLDVRNGATNGTAYDLQQGWATNCIARGGYRGFGSCRVNSRLVNCLAIGPSSIAAFELTDWQNAQALNCVAAGASYGFRYGNGTGAVLKNCVAYNNTTNFSGTYAAASTNNASSAASGAPGGNPVYSITSADFVNAASNDFHLAAGSALIGAGVNLYADFQTDIDGDTWPSSGAWDIGFDYRVAAGGGTTHNLATDAAAVATASANISLAVPIAAAAVSVASASGAMSVSIPLAAAAAAQAAASGDLSTAGTANLAATATATANASGGISLTVPLAASAVAQALAAAGISLGVPLAGAAAGESGAAAGISLNISLAGAALGEAASAASLSVTGASSLAASAAAVAVASAGLTLAVPVSGASVVVGSATGALSQIVPVAAAAAAASIATGGLDVSVRLDAAALVQALAAAALSVEGGLAADAAAEAASTGTLTLRINLDAAAMVQAMAAGALAAAVASPVSRPRMAYSNTQSATRSNTQSARRPRA